ncbi:16S rRNA (uracil(1498)-N(3))-methyltransferase ['Osedax' symbiont bacterium Rs2_46_30_T18]|nr:16S rRNA (uracil(1498)-N(3))-methyltransferase ['Osedax' symbiont bacterium Rs2_46_30_T18]
MRVPRFYQDCPMSVNQTLNLDEGTVQHVSRVLRMKSGEAISLFNGDGNEYQGELIEVAKRSVSVIISTCTRPLRSSRLKVFIGQSISRGERMDYAVQKSTELGMTSMTPLITERTEVKLKADRLSKRQQHWQQLAISACEQSLRTELPIIDAPCSLQQWLENCDADIKLVLHHHSEKSLDEYSPPSSVALLVGPEGGLSEAEVETAIAAGFHPVAFGPRVMRTETAPIAAQAILQYLWGDLN